jgi:uncharacterized protein YcbK (DUF882 family)
LKKKEAMSPSDYQNVPQRCQIARRRFIQWGAAGLLSAVIPGRGLAAVREFRAQEKSLSFFNTHTNEELEVVYWSRGRYRKQALAQIDRILRDHRTGEIRAIDTQLLDLVHALAATLHERGPFHVISGYRSPKTNALLRAEGRGVARNSLHLDGKALDIRLPGCKLSVLRRAAMDLEAGGVGYYPGPNFVHVDVGRVRYW